MTRHELKEQLQHDAFTDSVDKAVHYAATNRNRLIAIAAAVLAAVVLVVAITWFNSYRRHERENDLAGAFDVLAAPVGTTSQFGRTYPTDAAKQKAAKDAFAAVAAKDSGTHEGNLAQYYLGTLKAQSGDNAGAEADLKKVADANGDAGALAKIALAQLYAGQNRVPEAENLLKGLVNKPTDLVSKEQAQILLAQLDQSANPTEAKRILDSLRSAKNADPVVTRAIEQLNAPPTQSAPAQ